LAVAPAALIRLTRLPEKTALISSSPPWAWKVGSASQSSPVVTSKLAGATPSVRAINPRAPSRTLAASGTKRWTAADEARIVALVNKAVG